MVGLAFFGLDGFLRIGFLLSDWFFSDRIGFGFFRIWIGALLVFGGTFFVLFESVRIQGLGV